MTTLKTTTRRTPTMEEMESSITPEPVFKKAPGKSGDSSEEEIDPKKLRQDMKFYLPVLMINHVEMWPPIPKSERLHFTDEVAKKTCLTNCCGVSGLKSACCRMDPNDLEHVLGPLDEPWISEAIKWFKKKNIHLTRHDIVIDYEEGQIIGKNIFNGHPIFEDPKSYPIMRFQVDGPRFSCKFLNNQTGMCNIYEARPDMCRDYLCNFIKSNFLVKSKKVDPGKWKALNPFKAAEEEE